MLEVLWESLSDDEHNSASEPTSGPDEQLCLSLSKAASSGSPASRTIRFQGSIAGIPVVLLLDSGSSTSFISSAVASQLIQFKTVPQQAHVQIAGGGFLQSPGILHSVPWSVEHCQFSSDFRVLDLSSFDAIVGMDWLQAFSPMQIHWEHKWVAIPYKGEWVLLQGVDAVQPESLCLQLFAADANSLPSDPPAPLPPPIQHLVDSFATLFEPPTSLPPSRSCNHSIPLLPGAQPVFVRPYRYPPALKER